MQKSGGRYWSLCFVSPISGGSLFSLANATHTRGNFFLAPQECWQAGTVASLTPAAVGETPAPEKIRQHAGSAPSALLEENPLG